MSEEENLKAALAKEIEELKKELEELEKAGPKKTSWKVAEETDNDDDGWDIQAEIAAKE